LSVSVEFVGHACFRIWEDGRPRLVTDPFRFETLKIADTGYRLDAETVVVSSLTDDAHDNVGLVHGSPQVINALDVARGTSKVEFGGEPIVTIEAAEDPNHTMHSPSDNALYALRIGGLWFAHMGDLGYQLTAEQLAPFAGRCDALFALTGEQFTPTHEQLDPMIEFLQPRWIFPMHYNIPPVSFEMTKIEDFVSHRAEDPAVFVRHHTVELPLAAPRSGRPTIVVLDPSGYQRTG
jgi:L-ascorbate metabolism protein UlaG (beta-lactamase superfamily)